jgi:hypothetical protein
VRLILGGKMKPADANELKALFVKDDAHSKWFFIGLFDVFVHYSFRAKQIF